MVVAVDQLLGCRSVAPAGWVVVLPPCCTSAVAAAAAVGAAVVVPVPTYG